MKHVADVHGLPPHRPLYKPSPSAWEELAAALDDGESSLDDFEDLSCQTDCIVGCVVEPDGHCPHGYESAALTGGII